MLLMAHCFITKQARAAAELAQQQQRQLQQHTSTAGSSSTITSTAGTACLLEPASTADTAAVVAAEADSNPAAQVGTCDNTAIEYCWMCENVCSRATLYELHATVPVYVFYVLTVT
jgi:acyl CoA:acetate/3-ketoacid CoA transferase alpha subunit